MPSTNTTQAQNGSLRTVSFVHWYYGVRPGEIIRLWAAYMSAFSALFSFVFLFRTLFAPWKSIRDAYPTKGLNIQQILETLTLNATARAIGFVIRIFTMIAGLCIHIILTAGFLLYLLVWLTFPLIILSVIPVTLFLVLS